ncbi:hypothetical protein T10_7672 [Trichinella papuae]|uniref:Uncharacterized protein n=1 Tax=Trichinella papuae TaxID=268474 RepID=A0A0V1MG43_9BILA|nr:hypothetical protein T10_7672 [Trichinella papuae]
MYNCRPRSPRSTIQKFPPDRSSSSMRGRHPWTTFPPNARSVTLNYGGNLPPLIICGLATQAFRSSNA